jgi:quercetin dioxygenase-like cupin family protein
VIRGTLRREYTVGPAVVNDYDFAKGEGLEMHQHEYAHTTNCITGSCLIRVKGKEIVLTAKSQPILLPANIPHEIEALEDGTTLVNIYCVHNFNRKD